MIDLVKRYLENKVNYIYFEKEKILVSDIHKQLSNLAMQSKLATKDLSASDCYIIYKYAANKIKFKKLIHKKNSTYKTFNSNINKLLLSIVEKDNVSNNNYDLNMAIYLLLNALSQELINQSDIFDLFFDEKSEKDNLTSEKNRDNSSEKDNREEYPELNKILKISDISTHISDLKNPEKYKFDIISNTTCREEFAEEYIRQIRNEITKIEYFAIFYPCEFKHDFFANKYYEVEISPIKFKKKKDDIYKFVSNFYNDMEINTNLQEDIYSLKDYFKIPRFNSDICYFNPFENIEKFQDSYAKIKNDLLKNKKDFNEFINKLLTFLDTIQFMTISIQFANLLTNMTVKRTKSDNRKKSIREYIKEKLKANNLDEDKLFYQMLDEQNPKLIYNKNTDLKKLDLKNYPNVNHEEILQKYTQILQNLNLDETSTLKYDYSKFIIMFDNDFADFQLSKTSKLVVYKMIYDLITFYKDNEKLSTPFNSTIKKIFDKYEKKSLTELIDEGNITNFIKKYENEFNKYRRMSMNCPDYGRISGYISENNIEYIEIPKEEIELCKKEAKLLNLNIIF